MYLSFPLKCIFIRYCTKAAVIHELLASFACLECTTMTLWCWFFPEFFHRLAHKRLVILASVQTGELCMDKACDVKGQSQHSWTAEAPAEGRSDDPTGCRKETDGWLPAPCRSTAVRAYKAGISEMFNDMYQHNQDLFIQVFSYHIVFCIYWFSATESSSPCTTTSGLLLIYDYWK